MPHKQMRRATFVVALALSFSAVAVEAPAVSAVMTESPDHAMAAYDWAGPGQAFIDDWLDDWLVESRVAPLATQAEPQIEPARPSARSTTRHRQETRPAAHKPAAHKPASERRLSAAVARPKPRPVQPRSDALRVLRLARSALGANFRMGATGRGNQFDCSGLVYRVYQQAGLLSRVGGYRRGATSFYQWFKSRGQVSRGNGRPGDLVVYQHRGEHVIPHMGIYMGHGRVISALLNPWGVSSHGLSRIHIPFKAFLHVRIGR